MHFLTNSSAIFSLSEIHTLFAITEIYSSYTFSALAVWKLLPEQRYYYRITWSLTLAAFFLCKTPTSISLFKYPTVVVVPFPQIDSAVARSISSWFRKYSMIEIICFFSLSFNFSQCISFPIFSRKGKVHKNL